MNTFAIFALALVTLIPAADAQDVESDAARILGPFHQAVREAADPWREDLDSTKLFITVAKLADEHVANLAEELHELAVAELEALELREYDLDQYETRLESDIDVAKMLQEPSETSSTGMIIYQFWSAKQAAQQYRSIVLSRHMTPQAFGIMAFRDKVASPQTYRTSGDAMRTVLAIEAGEEVCFVEMDYVEPGIYQLASLRIMVKKG